MMLQRTYELIRFLQEHPDEDYTSTELGKMFGKPRKSIDMSFTRGVVMKDKGFRKKVEEVLPSGRVIVKSYLKLNKAGLKWKIDPSTVMPEVPFIIE